MKKISTQFEEKLKINKISKLIKLERNFPFLFTIIIINFDVSYYA